MSYTGHVDSIDDALILFEAYRAGRIPGFSRRLTEDEKRELIQANKVFIWPEDEFGLKRWTDGKKWSPSRVVGAFLGYQERSVCSNSADGKGFLCKKTLCVSLYTGMKLHMVSYYLSDVDITHVTTPSTDPQLADIKVNPAVFSELPKYATELASPGTQESRQTPVASPERMNTRPLPSSYQVSEAYYSKTGYPSYSKSIFDHKSPVPGSFSGNRSDHASPPAYSLNPLIRAASHELNQLNSSSGALHLISPAVEAPSTFRSLVHCSFKPTTFSRNDYKKMNQLAIEYLIGKRC